MKLPTIGELRHRIAIEQAVAVNDGGGGRDVSWSPLAEVWAAMRWSDGGERIQAEAVAGRSIGEIWIRHRMDVNPAHRFVLGTRVFDIKAAVDPDGRKRWLRCLVEERAA